jgi:hypothetical protein
VELLDPADGNVLCSWIDPRIEADDMFVALQHTNGHLFWCTNYGYFAFMPLQADSLKTPDGSTTESPQPIRVEGLTNLVIAICKLYVDTNKETRWSSN